MYYIMYNDSINVMYYYLMYIMPTLYIHVFLPSHRGTPDFSVLILPPPADRPPPSPSLATIRLPADTPARVRQHERAVGTVTQRVNTA